MQQGSGIFLDKQIRKRNQPRKRRIYFLQKNVAGMGYRYQNGFEKGKGHHGSFLWLVGFVIFAESVFFLAFCLYLPFTAGVCSAISGRGQRLPLII